MAGPTPGRVFIGEKREQLIRSFPSFLRNVAARKPDAIFFTARSAAPAFILANALWHDLGLGKKPMMWLISPNARLARPPTLGEEEKYLEQMTSLVRRHALAGKHVLIVDTLISTHASVNAIEKALEKASNGKIRTSLALTDDSLAGYGAVIAKPPLDLEAVPSTLRRTPEKIFPTPGIMRRDEVLRWVPKMGEKNAKEAAGTERTRWLALIHELKELAAEIKNQAGK